MSFTANNTGGEYSHTLTIAEMPNHNHYTHHWAQNTTPGWLSGQLYYGQKGSAGDHVTSSTGGGSAHNNLSPYIVVYFWRRTA